ncbi:hypothetical protein V2J09_005853 [Rumex salicifolius]
MPALAPNPEKGYNDVVVIGIDKDKNSQHAVKWAVDNLVVKDRRPVFLVHVRTQSLSSNPASDARTGRPPTEEEMHQLFLPYRGFCARKGIDAKEVVLHDIEVSSALIEYITTNLIGCIVCGGSNRNVLTRKLKAVDVPTSLGKLAPEYCAVYVVSKAKVQAMRTMENRSAPSMSESTAPNSVQMPNSPRASTSSLASTNTFNSKASPPHPLMQYTPIQNQYSSESTYTSWMSTSSDNSGYGNDRLSIDQMSEGDTPKRMPGHGFPSQRKLTKIPGLRTSSITNRSSFDQFSYTDKSEDSAPNSFVYRGGYGPLSNNYSSSHSSQSSLSTSSSSSMACTQEVEDEMQRLRLQLQQNMETLKYFDDEANIKHKMAKELEENKINSLDLEKHKQKVSKEVACISQQLAEIETRARNVKNIKYDEKESDDIQYRKFTLEDIEIATDYFSASLKVGEGGYGPVYKGELDNTKVAIKVLRPDVSQGLVQFKKEVEVLGRMKHPNLVLLLGACPEYGCLVYELMDYGSLEDRLFRKDNTPPIPWRIRFKIASEIATALHFLHSTKPEPLVHRDLKPANILLDQNFVPKICDVGLARLVPPAAAENMTQYHMTAAAGTFFYIDPEYQQTGLLSVKSDIYSLGVVFLQILTGRPAMGLSHAVDNAIEEGKFAGILDQSVDGWPIEDALTFARLALRCCELRKRDRPDLGSEVLPELARLSAYAISDTSTSISSVSYDGSSCNSPYAGSSWMSQAKSPS